MQASPVGVSSVIGEPIFRSCPSANFLVTNAPSSAEAERARPASRRFQLRRSPCSMLRVDTVTLLVFPNARAGAGADAETIVDARRLGQRLRRRERERVKPFGRGQRVVARRRARSTALSNEVGGPGARIATNVTSARPIISAAAVDAVRCGFRIALSRASLPGDAGDRRAGPAEQPGQRRHELSTRRSPRR